MDPIDALLALEFQEYATDDSGEWEYDALEAVADQCINMMRLVYSGAPSLALKHGFESLMRAWQRYEGSLDD